MRLICPNCGAQYEVPTEVIPEDGRDVQCSDCGTTWFQHHPDHPPAMEEETPVSEPAAPLDDKPEPESAPQIPDEAEYGSDDDDQGLDALDEEDFGAPEDEADSPTEPKRRELDASVANVLREEAEREARARHEDERGTLETQQELGLQETGGDAQRRSDEARARMARLRGEAEMDSVDAVPEDIDPSSRSNLLPDIDEISSSLNSDGGSEELVAPPATEDEAPAKRSGFRSGFRLVIILAMLALVVYVFAPQLSNAVPALADPLSGYVEMVNSWRAGLNEIIQNLAASLSGQENAGT